MAGPTHWLASHPWGIYYAAIMLTLLIGGGLFAGVLHFLREPEEVACVAIKYPDIGVLALPAPARHHHVMWARLFIDGHKTGGEAIQGFLTTHRRFVNREQALTIATKRGQIVQKHGNPDELYSEDMWDTPRESWGYTIDWLGYPDGVDE